MFVPIGAGRAAFILGSILLILAASGPASALEARQAASSRQVQAAGNSDGNELEVMLITVAPGDRVVSRFGHSAFWVRDSIAGTSLAYGFGLSDYRRPGFMNELVLGRVESWGDEIDAEEMLEQYRSQNRTIHVQHLNLTAEQRRELVDILEWRQRAENRSFNYDFYYFNCSTVLRDVLDEALDGELRAATSGVPASQTFRAHTRRHTFSDLPLFTFLMLNLSDDVDGPIDLWEEMFLPNTLRSILRDVQVTGPTGDSIPLVAAEEIWYESGEPEVAPFVPSPWRLFLAAGILIGCAIGFTGFAALRFDHSGWSVAFSIAAGAWVLTAGLAGAVLASLWAFTGQTLAYWNENLLQANPILLLVGVAAWGSRRRPALAAGVAWGILALALLGLALKIVPAFDQQNAPILALALPAHLGLAIGLVFWSRRTSPSTDPDRARSTETASALIRERADSSHPP